MKETRSLVRVAAILLRHSLSVIISAVIGIATPAAQIDQENWADAQTLDASIPQPVQEFIPTLTSLDSVQFFMNGSRSAVGWTGGETAVNVRQGSLDGPIIATSEPTYAPYIYDGPIGYGFSKPVPLVPGQLYALEPVNRYLQPLMLAFTADRYPGRLWTYQGQPYGGDLVFRVGLGLEIVPEPSGALLLLIGAGLLASRSFRYGIVV